MDSEKKYSDKTTKLAELCKALAHPARIEILKTVAKKNRCMCGEVVEVLPLAQSTVSQHLKELKKSGLISGEIEGPKSCYCINWKVMNQFSKLINEFSEKIDGYKCC
ncbi:MAG: winged helix-turn-helix transcriptional regulator [Ignavibacteriae bacterium]|nr:winged helix-turn-helix transcriptional regulator [Ignavibacteriota bacterium]